MSGLYDNIHKKRQRIKDGSGEKMRKPGSPGAPTDKAFKQAEKTAGMATGGYTDRWAMARGGTKPSLSVGRGEKQSVKEGGGLTAKGRAKYNKATGSNLKEPVTESNPKGERAARKKSFCARSRSWKGERGLAARRRWKC